MAALRLMPIKPSTKLTRMLLKMVGMAVMIMEEHTTRQQTQQSILLTLGPMNMHMMLMMFFWKSSLE